MISIGRHPVFDPTLNGKFHFDFRITPLQKKLTKTISDDVHDQQEWYWQSSFKTFCESTQPLLGQLWHCFHFSLFYHQICVSNHPLDVFIWHCVVAKQCRHLWRQRDLRKCNFSIKTIFGGNSVCPTVVIWYTCSDCKLFPNVFFVGENQCHVSTGFYHRSLRHNVREALFAMERL